MPSTISTTLAPHTAFVPKRLVHKDNPAEVLMTGWRPDGSDGFIASAHWPQTHGHYGTGRAPLDPLLLTETLRQSLPLLCHGAYGVPVGHHLLWDHFSYELTPEALVPKDRSGPVDVHVTCLDATLRGTRASALTLLFSVVQDGTLLADSTTRLTVQSPAVYQRLRAGRGTPESVTALPPTAAVPASPRDLGRTALGDIALSPTDSTTRWGLRVDTAHPFFFDHPLDHAPGILLLEAARQAAQIFPSSRPVSVAAMETAFSRYVELDAPCWVEAQPLPMDARGHRRTAVSMWQNSAQHFSATVKLVQAPESRSSSAAAHTGAELIPSPAGARVAVPVRT